MDEQKKMCSVCNLELPLDAFHVQSGGKFGRRADCKDCKRRFVRSPKGLIKQMLSIQVAKSRQRGDPPPSYTEEELYKWVTSQSNFRSLYDAWVSSGYTTDLRPSVDRINDYGYYTLDNIQLTTVKENVERFYVDLINGVNRKRLVAVDQYNLEGNFIQQFYSYAEACRAVGGKSPSNIQSAAEGVLNTAYGYVWKKPREEPDHAIVPTDGVPED